MRPEWRTGTRPASTPHRVWITGRQVRDGQLYLTQHTDAPDRAQRQKEVDAHPEGPRHCYEARRTGVITHTKTPPLRGRDKYESKRFDR